MGGSRRAYLWISDVAVEEIVEWKFVALLQGVLQLVGLGHDGSTDGVLGLDQLRGGPG